MNGLEQRLTEAREDLRNKQHEAFRGLMLYRHYLGKVGRIREEWLGLCKVSKKVRHKYCGHLVGLVLS